MNNGVSLVWANMINIFIGIEDFKENYQLFLIYFQEGKKEKEKNSNQIVPIQDGDPSWRRPIGTSCADRVRSLRDARRGDYGDVTVSLLIDAYRRRSRTKTEPLFFSCYPSDGSAARTDGSFVCSSSLCARERRAKDRIDRNDPHSSVAA